MRVLGYWAYGGPSIHACVPAVRIALDVSVFSGWPRGALDDGFAAALADRLPGLGDPEAFDGEPSEVLVRGIAGTDLAGLAELVGRAAVVLQNQTGDRVGFIVARATPRKGVFDVVFACRDSGVGMAAAGLAIAAIVDLLPVPLRAGMTPPPGFAFDAAHTAFLRDAERWGLDITAAALVSAAERRGIPWSRPSRIAHVLQLGEGRYQKCTIETTTPATSIVAVRTSSDKATTNRLLANAGLPVPHQNVVTTSAAAVEAAVKFGYPVVIKPLASGKGIGVSVAVRDAAGVGRAFETARRRGPAVLVEAYVAGDDHRLLVVGDRMTAAARRVPAHVVGDGIRTVRDLVDAENRSPRRGVGFASPLVRIELNDEASALLAEHGLGADQVPEAGTAVALRRTANLSTGGTAVDVTEDVHPDNRRMAVRAARIVGLDIAGIDFLTPDVGRSWKEVGAIIEVNHSPGMRPHWADETSVRDVEGAIVEHLFRPGTPSRIPIVGILDSGEGSHIAHLIAGMLEAAGRVVRVAAAQGMSLAGEPLGDGRATGAAPAEVIVQDPGAEAAVIECRVADVIERGLGYRAFDVGVLVGGAAGPSRGAEQDAALRLVVETADHAVVLDAGDAALAALRDAASVWMVAADADAPDMTRHREAGGRTATLGTDDGAPVIELREGDPSPATIPLGGIPEDAHRDTLFAAATARALGLSDDDIRAGLARSPG